MNMDRKYDLKRLLWKVKQVAVSTLQEKLNNILQNSKVLSTKSQT